MTWFETKLDGYDFCVQSGNYGVRRQGKQVGLYYHEHRLAWCDNVEEGMFRAWVLGLYRRKENE